MNKIVKHIIDFLDYEKTNHNDVWPIIVDKKSFRMICGRKHKSVFYELYKNGYISDGDIVGMYVISESQMNMAMMNYCSQVGNNYNPHISQWKIFYNILITKFF